MKLIVGNQKTVLNREQVLDFIENTKIIDCSDVVICPSYPYIDLYNNNSKFIVGAQNVSAKESGATTGEVSAEQLKSLNVKYSIVGHSERREYQKENSDIIYDKIINLLKFGIKPILCVGENLEERKSGITKDIIGKEILEVFDRLGNEMIKNIVIAYEPIWAIGTGLIPNNEEIIDIILYIKDLISDKYGGSLLVLYGGSVNKKNITELNTIEVIDGYLIGGASTKSDDFICIIKECNNEKEK